MVNERFQVSSVRLIDADIKALPTTPFELVAAPGASRIIIPVSTHIHFKSAAAYTNLDPLLAFTIIRGTAGGPLFSLDQVDSMLASVTDIDANMLELTAYDAPSDISGKALNLKIVNGSAGAFTGGNATNQLIVSVAYWIKRV